MVRGIRSYSDMDSEFTMGIVNRKLGGIETLFLHAKSNRIHISSSMIRELAHYETRLANFVPKLIEDEVYDHLF
jgi:pantetheine-phosphate adenylyltransferase